MSITPEAGARVPTEYADDAGLVERLRSGEEQAFIELIERYHAALLRLARVYVRDTAVAQDVVQDTWLAVLRGLDRFEARSSLKTWIFRILINIARTRATREQRSVPLSTLLDSMSADAFEPAVEPERFLARDAPRWPGHWVSLPMDWEVGPEVRFLARETRTEIQAAIDALPANQRAVMSLRDAAGWTAAEVCNILQISETNQRVLLHRGRSRVRRALERYLTRT